MPEHKQGREVVVTGKATVYGPDDHVMFMSQHCAELIDADAKALLDCSSSVVGSPIVYCHATKRYFILSWRQILEMAVAAGITDGVPTPIDLTRIAEP